MELDLAYAITIHKSLGSEFKAVIIPVFTQHFKMLYRKPIYCRISSYLQTMANRGYNPLIAVQIALAGSSSLQG